MMDHLGGHCWKTHVDEGVLKLFRHVGCNTLLDVGCGPAGNVIKARELGMEAYGIDGDPALQVLNVGEPPLIFLHDYTLGKLDSGFKTFDVGLSTEFLEHVEEQYLPNIMDTFQRCHIVVCTHALPGETGGHHHVNLQTEEWWIAKFKEYGFDYSEFLTNDIKEKSTMKKGFMRKTGKVFINEKVFINFYQ
jgi:SAM-dependent methyltransferase